MNKMLLESNIFLAHLGDVVKSKRARMSIIFSLCTLFIALNSASLLIPPGKSITFDEESKYESGIAILSGKASERGEDNVNLRNNVPISALNPLFSNAVQLAIPNQLVPTSITHAYRVFIGRGATIIVSVLLGIFVYIWAKQLYGVYAGFFALTLYFLDPNIIAHSRLVTQDIYSATSIFIATYFLWKFLQSGSRLDAFASALTFGIAQITRFTSIYLLIINFLLVSIAYIPKFMESIRSQNLRILLSRLKEISQYISLLIVTTLLIINIGYSFERTLTKFGDYQFESQFFRSLQESPTLSSIQVPLPYAYLQGIDFGKYKQETGFGSGIPYMLGEQGLENGEKRGFKSYYLVAFFYKAPIATQIFIFVAIVNLFIQNKRYFWRDDCFLLIPSFCFLLFVSNSNAQLGIRYILQTFPFLFVFSSRLVPKMINSKRKVKVIFISLLTYLLISNFSFFPHYLSYFNEFLVNRKLGYHILADSNLDWGQNSYYLEEYLRENQDAVYLSSGYGSEITLRTSNETIIISASDCKPDDSIFESSKIIISANELVGIFSNSQYTFLWLRDKTPVAHLSYNYLIFEVDLKELISHIYKIP